MSENPIIKSLIGISGHGMELIGQSLNTIHDIGKLYQLRNDNIPDLRVLSFSGKIGSCSWEFEKLHTSIMFEEIKTMTQGNPDISTWKLLQDIQQKYKSAYIKEIERHKEKNSEGLNIISDIQPILMQELRIVIDEIEELEKDTTIETDPNHKNHSRYIEALQKYEKVNKALKSFDNNETDVMLENAETVKAITGEPFQIISPQNDKLFQFRSESEKGDGVYYALENLSDITLKDGTIIPMGVIIDNGTLTPIYEELFDKIMYKKVSEEVFEKGLFERNKYGIFKEKIVEDKLRFSDIISLFAIFGVEVQNYIDTTCREVNVEITDRHSRTLKRGELIGPIIHRTSKGKKIYHAGKNSKKVKKSLKKKNQKKKSLIKKHLTK